MCLSYPQQGHMSCFSPAGRKSVFWLKGDNLESRELVMQIRGVRRRPVAVRRFLQVRILNNTQLTEPEERGKGDWYTADQHGILYILPYRL